MVKNKRNLGLPGVNLIDLSTDISEIGFDAILAGEHLGIKIKQANMSITYPGIIRSWHKHLKNKSNT